MSDIDDIFKNNLNEKGITYHDSYWEEMEKLLEKKKRKKGFLIMAFLTLAILGLIIIGVFYSGNNITVQPKPVQNQQATVSEISKNNSSLNDKPNSGNTQSSVPDIASEPLKERNKPAIVKTPDINSNNNGDQTTEIPSAIPDETITASIEKTETPPIEINDLILAEDDTKLNLLQFKMPKIQSPAWDITAINYMPELKRTGIGLAKNTKHKDSISKTVKWQFYLAPVYEYDRYSRKVNNALLKVDEKTQNRSGFNMSLSAKKGNWGLRSGFGFLQLSELTNYVTVNKSYQFDTSYNLVNPNYGLTASGSRIALIKREIDTKVILNNTINDPNGKVNFRYLKIPLMATYGMTFGRFGFSLEAGINTSFLLSAKGNYTSFENNLYSVKNIKESNDVNKVLLQTAASFNLKYRIGKSLSICSGYGILSAMNSMVKSYDQKPKIDLFTFGLEYKL